MYIPFTSFYYNYFHLFCSFETLWMNFEGIIELDPILMKILVYMCPQNELVHILQHAPPILGISYLINIWNEKKSIKDIDKEVFI